MASQKILKFGNHLKELRIHLCQKSQSSSGVRQFLEESYVELKQANPKFPILVRECSNITPKLYVRYAFGRELNVSLENKSSSEILTEMNVLAERKN